MSWNIRLLPLPTAMNLHYHYLRFSATSIAAKCISSEWWCCNTPIYQLLCVNGWISIRLAINLTNVLSTNYLQCMPSRSTSFVYVVHLPTLDFLPQNFGLAIRFWVFINLKTIETEQHLLLVVVQNLLKHFCNLSKVVLLYTSYLQVEDTLTTKLAPNTLAKRVLYSSI